MGYLIKWDWVGNEWRPMGILNPKDHTHYLSLGKIRYEAIGSTPINYNDENTKWQRVITN